VVITFAPTAAACAPEAIWEGAGIKSQTEQVAMDRPLCNDLETERERRRGSAPSESFFFIMA
jgi:hypothetical protein